MIVAASYATKKVREGYKNKFAYVLLGFTFLLGISYAGIFFVDAFKIKVTFYDDYMGKDFTDYVRNF